MAKILSSPWSIIRGSIAGTTYLSGPHNAIIARQRTSPVNPSTIRQAIVRGAMSVAQATWQGATQAVRDDWALYAKTVVYSGPMGDYNPSGQQAFMATIVLAKYMKDRFATLVDVNDTPPVLTGSMLQGPAVTAPPGVPGTGVQITVGNSDLEAGFILVNISPAYSQARNFFKGPWTTGKAQVATTAAQSGAALDFIGLVSGQAYFFSSRLIGSGALHRISSLQITRAVATTSI